MSQQHQPTIGMAIDFASRGAAQAVERTSGLSGLADEVLPLLAEGIKNFSPAVGAALSIPAEVSTVANIVRLVRGGATAEAKS